MMSEGSLLIPGAQCAGNGAGESALRAGENPWLILLLLSP